jgi:ketosteroid isomerase-like protein
MPVAHRRRSLAFALMLAGCSTPSADTRADEEALRKLDAEWVNAAQSKQVDAWVAFYADDAAVLPPNEVMATDRDSIRKSVSGLLGLSGLTISWQPMKVESQRRFGVSLWPVRVDLRRGDGKRTTDRGKIVEIWKKQADGNWKCIVDTWNSDLPAAAPSTPSS